MAKIGRNDPCACGSGKKHKRCCGAVVVAAVPRRDPVHDMDTRLVEAILDHARRRIGRGPLEQALDDYPFDVHSDPIESQLFQPWLAYEAKWEGRRLVERFLEAHRAKLPPRDVAWLEAQQRARLSIWEVTAIEPERGVTATDLLTHEERFVHELSLTRVASMRLALLARVVDFEGRSFFIGSHPRPLAPDSADGAVRSVKSAFGKRSRAIAASALKEYDSTLLLLDAWADAVETADEPRPPPRLVNTDGEDLLWTVDRFAVSPSMIARVLEALHAMDGAVWSDDAPDDVSFLREGNAMHASWENTNIGRASLDGTTLRLESNSMARADALRARVERACTGLELVHRGRTHEDPLSSARPAAEPTPAVDSREASEIVREMKQQHYEAWLDSTLPALGQRSPRDAIATPSGRRAVDLLLKTMEMHESGEPEDQRVDVGALRRKLGLDQPSRGRGAARVTPVE